jgi:two-component system, chemotaxis family, CheB/CheR fusion protein
MYVLEIDSFSETPLSIDNNGAEIRLSYRRLFEAAKDGILILDADTGRINDVNPFLIELCGASDLAQLLLAVSDIELVLWNGINDPRLRKTFLNNA